MIIHDLRVIGEKLFRIRKQTGKTQLQIATEADMSDRTYSELERGVANVRIATVLKACDALHITPDEILTDCPEQAAAREEDIIARLRGCSPRDKETALRILEAFLRSLE